MTRADVQTVVMVAALMMGGVATWASFSARAQVDIDAQEAQELAESNLEMIEALGARIHQGTPAGTAPAAGPVDGDVAAELAHLREALAAANTRISRVHTERAELQDRVRRHLEETAELTSRVATAEREVQRLLEHIRDLEKRVPQADPIDLGRTE